MSLIRLPVDFALLRTRLAYIETRASHRHQTPESGGYFLRTVRKLSIESVCLEKSIASLFLSSITETRSRTLVKSVIVFLVPREIAEDLNLTGHGLLETHVGRRLSQRFQYFP